MATKIYLNDMAQKMLFGYLEGVDWQIDLCKIDPNDKSDNPKYILLPEEEQDRIHNKVTNWTHQYKKKYNGKYAEMELDKEVNFYLNMDSENQISVINSEVLNPSNDVEDLFEWYMSSNGREYNRVMKGKENLYNQYVLAKKQLNKLVKLTK